MKTVSVQAQPAEVQVGASVTLTASISDGGSPATWRWESSADAGATWEPVDGANATTTATPAAQGSVAYRATPLASDGTPLADTQPGQASVTVTPAGQAAPAQALTFPGTFASVTAVILLLLVLLFVWWGGLFTLGVSMGDEVAKADPRAVLAAKVIGPVLAIGVLLLLAGLWMVLNEWRAAFKTATPGVTTRGGFDSLTDLVKSVANLKGSSLIFVGGLVALLAVAWMVSSTAGGDGAGTTPAASASASAAPSSAAPTSAGTPT